MNTAVATHSPDLLAPPVAGGAATPTTAGSLKNRIETLLATVFGAIFLGLSVVVTVETLSRKLFNVSLQGADELGGYALAVGSTIAVAAMFVVSTGRAVSTGVASSTSTASVGTASASVGSTGSAASIA